MRLIDADAYQYPGDLIYEPTIDAVEVVRCKDCKRYCGTNYGSMVCGKFDVISCEDDFCVWGERKMDAEVNDNAELV